MVAFCAGGPEILGAGVGLTTAALLGAERNRGYGGCKENGGAGDGVIGTGLYSIFCIIDSGNIEPISVISLLFHQIWWSPLAVRLGGKAAEGMACCTG